MGLGIIHRLTDLVGVKGTDGSAIASTANPVPVALPAATVTALTPPATFPLPTAQVTTLTPPAMPSEFPLPSAQVTTLTPPAFLATFPLPTAQVTTLTPPAMPSEFPLPAAQVTTLTPPAAITGFATAAKQLPDGHSVTVANPTANPETGLAKTIDVEAVRDRLPAALRTSRLDAADVYTEMEALAEQSGAGAALTFTFASAVQLAWVRSVGGISRAVVGSQTPTAVLGAYCADDEPHPITVNGTIVKVYAPVGATVSVWGYRYN